MAKNAAGLVVSGDQNPNWKGGLLSKECQQCGKPYQVKRAHASSKFCSLQCVGKSQRGKNRRKTSAQVSKACERCGAAFLIYRSHAHKKRFCSPECSGAHRSEQTRGEGNPNWWGGASRFPYPWNFREISKAIIERDGGQCQNPTCRGEDERMTTHHINYDKSDCGPRNLIALCSSCNSRANFDRDQWQAFYEGMMAERFKVAADIFPFRFIAVKKNPKKSGGGWSTERF